MAAPAPTPPTDTLPVRPLSKAVSLAVMLTVCAEPGTNVPPARKRGSWLMSEGPTPFSTTAWVVVLMVSTATAPARAIAPMVAAPAKGVSDSLLVALTVSAPRR